MSTVLCLKTGGDFCVVTFMSSDYHSQASRELVLPTKLQIIFYHAFLRVVSKGNTQKSGCSSREWGRGGERERERQIDRENLYINT